MRNRTQMGGYRGRRTWHDTLKLFVIFLAVVAFILGGVLFFGREHFGLDASLFQPQDMHIQSDVSQNQIDQSKIDEETAPPTELETIEKTLEPGPKPEPEVETPVVLSVVELTLEEALQGQAESLVEQAGGTGLILNMKPASGSLGWVSQQEMALAANANSTLEGVNEQLKQLNSTELYTVARMSCFRDNLLAGTKAYCIRSNSDYRWKDFGGVYWTTPSVEEVQDYLIALMVELAELGFDEILLEHCGYPQTGSGEMGWIRKSNQYNLEHLDAVVGEFLQKATQALEPYDVVLSIRTNGTVVSQDGARTGLTPTLLELYAQRVWMRSEDGEPTAGQLLTKAGVTGLNARLVEEVAMLDSGRSMHQAQFKITE